MPELHPNQLFAATSLLAFVFGMIVMRLIDATRSSQAEDEDPRNHMIRDLEADLRATRRQVEEQEKTQSLHIDQIGAVQLDKQQLTKLLTARDRELSALRAELNAEARKVRDLRHELQDRATETIREHVRAEEATTELEVARAGSEAVLSEITRLQEERKSLTSTMRQLEDTLRSDEHAPADTLADS